MIKYLTLCFVVLTTLQSHCDMYAPVCGINGITYFNECKCKESKVDIGYNGPCRTNSNTAEPLKWGNFS